jgi:hypothetical protein
MISELLLHVDEELTEAEQADLLLSMGNRPGAIEPHLHSEKSHLMFVAYDTEDLCPHDLVEMAQEGGVHAQVIEL